MSNKSLRKTYSAGGRAVGPGALAEIHASEKRRSGVMVDAVPPSVEAIRAAIAEQKCPFCGSGPFKMLPVHTNKIHGVDKWDLRELAGLATTDPLCDASSREKMRESAIRNQSHVHASKANKLGRRPQRWTSTGAARNVAAIKTWMDENPELAIETRRQATIAGHADSAKLQRVETMRANSANLSDSERAERRQAIVARLQTPAAQAKRKEAIAASFVMPEHGTTARYKHGCRCESCRVAKREYRRGLLDATH